MHPPLISFHLGVQFPFTSVIGGTKKLLPLITLLSPLMLLHTDVYNPLQDNENGKFHGFPSLTPCCILMTIAAVNRLFQSDITKLFVFFILTIVGATIISPWVYNVGMFLAEVGESRKLNSILHWVAQQSANATFTDCFNFSLVLCALLLAGPFIMWLSLGNETRQSLPSPWRIRLPKNAIANENGQSLCHNSHAGLHLATGFLLTGGLLTLAVWLLLIIGWLSLDHPVQWWQATRNALASAAILAIVMGWLFQGMILGIFLRAMRPAPAIISISLIFAFIHFFLPSEAVQIDDPCTADAGFRMLKLVTQNLMNPQAFAFGFISLAAAGLILGYARYRTASLWLPIGLHAGWIFAHRSLQQITDLDPDHPTPSKLLIGDDRISGILPLCLLIITGLLVHIFAQTSDNKSQSQAG